MERHCAHCQALLVIKIYPKSKECEANFLNRKYCGRACMAAAYEGRIKVPNEKNSRRQSVKQAAPACEQCGKSKNLQVHHADENPMNNDPSNLRTLCVSCHRRCHSPNFTATGEQRKPCEHCSAPSMKKGWCFTHLSRFKRFGHPLGKKRRTALGWVLMLHDGKNWLPFPSLPDRPQNEAAPTGAPPQEKKASATASAD